MAPIRLGIAGAGQRGRYAYGRFISSRPDLAAVGAVVDRRHDRRAALAREHEVPPELCFESLGDALDAGVELDAWIVATPDRDHFASVTALLDSGADVLVEKPMAASPAESLDLVRAAAKAGRLLAVAHVLRYTPFFQTLHRIVTSGRLGSIVTVEHRENIVAWHMAHSFVRGNWSKTADATPMIVQKCCHDFDIIAWNLPSDVVRVTSIGSLFHFKPENAPEEAPARCTDGCPVDDCPYDARRIYLDPARTGWPVHVITEDLSPEGRLKALQSGPYGLCAYKAGSDVVDHQAVTMELANGTSVVLVMHGHSHEEARTMRYDGTRATLRGRFGAASSIEVIDHVTGEAEQVDIDPGEGGHGGGDHRLITSFIRAIRGREPMLTTAGDGLEGHLLAFAADEAHKTGGAIDMAVYRARFN